ncbi:hypothetical protein [Muricauda sp. MAR_2010_75]|uniref:hypothetical protein n=1 Tax=Allomuricauda sp. MAR_2010_75 TaxID=1250232 RepID=UPI0012E036F2|nr:hypothetical protein [Muricauda sp. MAR_2010_75]
MKNLAFLGLLLIIVFNSCTDEVVFSDLVEIEQSRMEWIANGSDTLSFSITFNSESVIDKISAEATISNGTFVENDMTTLTFVPKRTPDNTIESKIIVKSSTNNSESTIEFNINEFKEEFTIMSNPSTPSKIELSASAFSVQSEFGDEINLTGTVRNSGNKMVSQGVGVLLEDILEDGQPVNGRFRNAALNTNSNSQISAIYTVGNILSYQDIYIVATVLDENKNKTEIIDSVQIFVNPKE